MDRGNRKGRNTKSESGSQSSNNNRSGKTITGRKGFFRKKNNPKNSTLGKSRFTGDEEKLKGHIFDADCENKGDLFHKTKTAIEDYVGRTYDYGGDVRNA